MSPAFQETLIGSPLTVDAEGMNDIQTRLEVLGTGFRV